MRADLCDMAYWGAGRGICEVGYGGEARGGRIGIAPPFARVFEKYMYLRICLSSQVPFDDIVKTRLVV